MINIRQAILRAMAGQYTIMAINLMATLALARLLTPAEFGIAAIGGAVVYIAEAVREIGGGTFLVREPELSPEKVRSTFTVSLLATIAVVAAFLVIAEPLADFFAAPGLALYVRVVALGFCVGPFIYPLMALMSRELAFGRLAIINLVATIVRVIISIGLAVLGYSAMSLAWAEVASAVTCAFLCLVFCNAQISHFRPSLAHWRDVVGFGAFSSLTAVIGRVNEALPFLIFGKVLGTEASALGQRALMLCLLPQKVVMTTIGSVALPILSKQVRDEADLKTAYLSALSNISVVEWPALAMLAILAQPIVLLLLGPRWLDVAPLIQILAPALTLSLPIYLQYPILVAVGAVRQMPVLLLCQACVLTGAVAMSAHYGLHAAAMSMLVALPVNGLLSLVAVRRNVAFRWTELASALRRSALVALLTAAGPMLIAVYCDTELSMILTFTAIGLGAAGWAFGLYATGHSLWGEFIRLRAFGLQRA